MFYISLQDKYFFAQCKFILEAMFIPHACLPLKLGLAYI